MSLPSEHRRALINTRSFLFSLLLAGGEYKPNARIRERASDLLKHYPFTTDIDWYMVRTRGLYDCSVDRTRVAKKKNED